MNACNPRAYTIPGCDSLQAALAPQRPRTPLPLAPVGGKTVALDCDGGRLSSDAGLVLLKDIDAQLGLTRALAAALSDARDARRIRVTPEDILKQRIFQIAAGYEDANDANTLRHDPLFKLLLERLPETGAPLASQPTISRFENRVSRTALSRMALVLMDPFIAAYDSPPAVSVLDVDDTEDRAHGEQEHLRYDGYYGGYCFLPCPLYEGLSGRLITTILKAKRFSGAPMLAVLKRVGKRLQHAWPDPWVILRGDSHCAYPEVMAWMEAQPQLSYVIGLTSNAVLQKLAQEVVEQAKRAYACWGRKAPRFHSTRYQAGTWARSRRVVIKGEVSVQGVNTRFVVTAMEHARTQGLYRQIYCARGQMENEIKDHKLYLKSDRTSCHRFEAHQVRVFLHAAAYMLLDTLRREVLRTTPWACATMETIQLRLLKLGARVQECKDRIKISLPSSCPVAPVLRRWVTLLGGVRLPSQAL
jgi:Transposase DDE domain group 1